MENANLPHDSNVAGNCGGSESDYELTRARPYQDPEILRDLYHDEGLSQSEIADRFDVHRTTITHWMNKHDIETRPPMGDREPKDVYRIVDGDEKVQYLERNNELGHLVYRHQLVALLEYDPEDVFHPDTHIHHLMGAPAAVDVPENLTVLDAREHIKRHAEGTATDDPRTILDLMRDDFEPMIGGSANSHSGGNE
ncbi:hypothetical protein [Halobellus inordinatus]|uniref:hypothetical protein n=1 Tax=Halobellus inordinatus TaxID=1126236 RepID=UPI0021145ABD|nr:hypothetical protein [Halobellus ramosii]